MKILHLLLALLFIFGFHFPPLCEAVVLFVKPHNTTCPHTSNLCYTLDYYVRNSTKYFVSNAIFEFLGGYHHLSSILTVSNIHNITFRHNKSDVGRSFVYADSKSLSMMFENSSDIFIRDMNFQTLNFIFENSTNITLTEVTAENSSFTLINVFESIEKSHFKCINCGISFEWTVTQFRHYPNTTVLLYELNITESTIYISGFIPGVFVMNSTTFNRGSDIYIYSDPSYNDIFLLCENTYFSKKSRGLSIKKLNSVQCKYTVAVALHNVSYLDSSGIVFSDIQNVIISNCYFKRIYGGAIVAIDSVLHFMDNVTFIDNHSYRGGAISLYGDSYILVQEAISAYILFENNTADDVGGAMYFSTVVGLCSMYVEHVYNKIVFNFSMNSAVNGGNAIYGAYLDTFSCYSPNGTLFRNLSKLILSVSSFTPSFHDDPSVVTSDARHLCFCADDREIRDCFKTQLSVYPGQVFSLYVTALGDMNGLVKWPVYATVSEGEFSDELQHSQYTNDKKCAHFHYSILSKEKYVALKFTLSLDIDNYLVELLDCPLGFALSSNYECVCEKRLQNIENITCNITDQSIQRQGSTWIGVLENTTTLVFTTVCPLLYCNRTKVKIQTSSSRINQDIQCTNNRSGILCGGCRENFSLALGSNRCLQACSNKSLALLIAFAAAGIALVFFIKILNLTVSQGTINGLIFYANIVGAEQTLLLSSKKSFEEFLSVFIAWVNLDLGIETCFFDGMDAYAKAWLQFAFPLYVWIIALFIIILSHYSIRASKLFGNNSVPVLATLILLSYSKLLRAVISALSLTNIQFLNGSTSSVWERDGTIQYLTGKHIPLLVFAVAVLVLLWFPFTLILVSIQWLQRGTHYRVLHWVTKLRPFFDAFTGPLKDKHRYWVGALLLVRCSLLLFFYIYTSNGNGVAFISIMFATLLILVYLAGTGHVYKHYYLTVLELSYILNLGTLATGTLYVWYVASSGNQEALVMTSVGFAFLQFIAILIYHGHVQLRQPLKKLVLGLKMKLFAGGEENVQYESLDGSEDEDYESIDEDSYIHNGVRLQRPPFQEIDLPKRDEPLLIINN